MTTVIQIRDYQPRERSAPDRPAKVLRLPSSLGARVRKIRAQLNKPKIVTIVFK